MKIRLIEFRNQLMVTGHQGFWYGTCPVTRLLAQMVYAATCAKHKLTQLALPEHSFPSRNRHLQESESFRPRGFFVTP